MEIDPNKETLILSDDKVFYTIEGEGEFVGQPSVFMRLAMCNLTCNAWASEGSPNGCDSYISWSVKNKMTFQEIWDEFFSRDGQNFAQHLNDRAILKITGGEPLIQEKQLLKFVEFLHQKMMDDVSYNSPMFRIDFETNATLLPHDDWVMVWDATFTTSPKLSTNGDPVEKSYKPEVLKWHRNHGSSFKFVVTCSEDIDEIWNKFVKPIDIPEFRIWLMPCCGSRQEHVEAAEAVAEYAKALHVNFSPRLQLVIWDKALKV
jgi:organic radical activating enzyme